MNDDILHFFCTSFHASTSRLVPYVERAYYYLYFRPFFLVLSFNTKEVGWQLIAFKMMDKCIYGIPFLLRQ